MLQPDSMGSVVVCVLLALIAVGGVAKLGVRWWAVLPALCSLLAAVLAGALWVNVSYGYYQRWTDAFRDLAGEPLSSEQPSVAAPAPDTTAGSSAATPGQAGDNRPGRLVTVTLAGPQSGVSRSAVVWLPAAYDDPGQATHRFPVLMLMHGDPGEARGFVYGMHIDQVADDLARSGRMPPTVIVMPTVWQGWHGQQCLDAIGGPKDETYLTKDVPAALQRQFRVEPPGPSWVAAGLSEGGYCAANLALRHPDLFAGAASLDGYYAPITSRGVGTRLFGPGSGPGQPAQQAATPLLTIQAPGRPQTPALWVMSGTGDSDDHKQATLFVQAASRVTPVRVVTVTGGKHTTPAWRAALPDLLQWSSTLASTGHAGVGELTLPLEQ